MKPRLEVLAPAQRELWDEHAKTIPAGWVLYGGTAIALRLGHRRSIDFDFFSDLPLDEDELRREVPCLRAAQVLHRAPNTLDVTVPFSTGEVKLSFFGGIGFGRVSRPDLADNGIEVAGALDLLAIKLKVLLQRVEAKDYVDIDVLLRSGLSLSEGLSAAAALFPLAMNPLDAAKAVAWFKDGQLETRLTEETKRALTLASASVDPAAIHRAPLASEHLAARISAGIGVPAGREAGTKRASAKRVARKKKAPVVTPVGGKPAVTHAGARATRRK
jgi:hypothetical protein